MFTAHATILARFWQLPVHDRHGKLNGQNKIGTFPITTASAVDFSFGH
jgi:hypothetical protein